ncbi:unnamed protein product [Rotaria sp. Silwood1]|nr:unnamed protein product [Rotaria sp. Silwood1]
MFIRLWVTSIFLIIIVQTTVINNSKGQASDNLKLLKQDPLDYDYDLNDQKLLGNNIEGSGGAASLDEYADDLEDDAYYNEFTVTNKISTSTTTKTYLTTRYLTPTTRQSLIGNHTAPIWILFKFLTRPPIAAGILVGLAIGIFTSVILLICIIQRYHKREKSHSSYTTGLLYPNQYGYSKSPQEFYA